MKKNNLKVLASCLSILISFIFFGCAQQGMTGAMDKSMEPAMEKPMNADMGTMNEQKMDAPMQEMTDQKMDGAMEEMKSDSAENGMGGMNDKKMIPEKEKMMK